MAKKLSSRNNTRSVYYSSDFWHGTARGGSDKEYSLLRTKLKSTTVLTRTTNAANTGSKYCTRYCRSEAATVAQRKAERVSRA